MKISLLQTRWKAPLFEFANNCAHWCEGPRGKGNVLFSTLLHHMKDHLHCPIGRCITDQAKLFLKVIMDQQR